MTFASLVLEDIYDASKLLETFPTVEMVFGEGQKLSLSPGNYLFRHSRVDGAYCLGIFQNGKDPTTLLGGIIVRNTFVMYDHENNKIGFWKTNCSDLWARLHASDTPNSSPSPSIADMSPSSPPMGPTYHISPESNVGSIIFYMSLNIKYSELAPHITELTQFIAMELNVNNSQVVLLDFMSEGNGSLTIWSVTPPKPDEYMSNENAYSIIALIAEDETHLPESFRKHWITNWYIESEPNRTWWRKYTVAVIIFILAIVFGLSALVTWWFWRHKYQTKISYRSVDSAGHEQELQPL